MPSGYTQKVNTGEVTEFKDFALICARAFGALVHMRDDPSGATIRPDTVGDFYPNLIVRAQARIHELQAMTKDEIEAAAEADYQSRLAYEQERLANYAAIRQRYEAMIAKVEAWTPPTPDHAEMKSFMLNQLRSSMDFDCNYPPSPVERIEASRWFYRQLKAAKDDLQSAQDHLAEETKRVNERNAWVEDLMHSLE